MALEPGRQLHAGISEQEDIARSKRHVMRVAAQVDCGDSAGMDGEAELGLQRVDCTGPVDRRTGPFVGAVTQPFQPAGLYVLVRKPAVDAKAAQPT